jgi:hypothetical protein
MVRQFKRKMTVVEQIYKDIEITFDIHDPVRKYFESRRGEWLEKEKQQIVMAHEQGRSDKHNDFSRDGEKYWSEQSTSTCL